MAFEELFSASSISLPRQEEIRVSVVKNGNKHTIDVRKWYTNDTDEMAPTGKGIHIPADVIKEVLSSINEASKHIPADADSSSTNGKAATPAPAKKAAAKKVVAKKVAPRKATKAVAK